MVVQVTEKAEFYGVRGSDAPALRFVEIAAPARKHRESSLVEEIARLFRPECNRATEKPPKVE